MSTIQYLPLRFRINTKPVFEKFPNWSNLCGNASQLIQAEETVHAGIITINRPEKHNALNLGMVRYISSLLKKWDKSKSLLVLKSNGNAFCSGADLKALHRPKDNTYTVTFTTEIYKMNYMFASVKIPTVVLADGIAMGDGAALAMYGKYTVATERTIFAMPETEIGHIPDAGSSYVFSRLPGKLGLFLGMTGARLSGKDLKALGLVSYFCENTELNDIKKDIFLWKSEKDIKNTLDRVCSTNKHKFSFADNLPTIDACFASSTVEQIFENLSNEKSPFLEEILKVLSRMCPLTLKLTVELYKMAPALSFKECVQLEYRLFYRYMNDYNFHEGIRAKVIVKNSKPIWKPARLQDITQNYIQSLTERLPENFELRL